MNLEPLSQRSEFVEELMVLEINVSTKLADAGSRGKRRETL